MLSRLCIVICLRAIKNNDVTKITLQLPFKIAFNIGKKCANEGTGEGAEIIFDSSITTTKKTNTDIPVMQRNINLSVMSVKIQKQ